MYNPNTPSTTKEATENAGTNDAKENSKEIRKRHTPIMAACYATEQKPKTSAAKSQYHSEMTDKSHIRVLADARKRNLEELQVGQPSTSYAVEEPKPVGKKHPRITSPDRSPQKYKTPRKVSKHQDPSALNKPPTEVLPHYKDYQLLGDSQLLRFSEQVLNFRGAVTYAGRRLGYCVSGQKIRDLEQRLKRNEYQLRSKVVMLIGTNDIVQGTEQKQMYEGFESILSILKAKAKKIVILTVPPVPKLVIYQNVHRRLERFNVFVQKCADGHQVFALDLANQYMNSDHTIMLRYYEATYDNNEARVDLVHLNWNGFELLKNLLDKNLDKIA